MAKTAADQVLAGLGAIRADLEACYRDLHAHPELGFQEFRTSALVSERLKAWGFSVTGGVAGTGVVGVLVNGPGPVVLLRSELDALPGLEKTGLPYAPAPAAEDTAGAAMHACGHDIHISCLLGAARLMSEAAHAWSGTLIALFQPAEETGEGARAMLAAGLAARMPRPDVALAQHVFHAPAGYVGTRQGPFLSGAETMRVVLHGRGAHGSKPEASVDPVVLAAMVVLRLQTIVSRELGAADRAVVTVARVRAGEAGNAIPDSAELLINIRAFTQEVRAWVIEAVIRMVRAECQASRAPREPQFEHVSSFPPTVNDPRVTARVSAAFAEHFGDGAGTEEPLSPSDDFSEIPAALGIPFTFWVIGGTDPAVYARAESAGTVTRDVPVNHSPGFAPIAQPTLDVGVRALVVAALSWLGATPE